MDSSYCGWFFTALSSTWTTSSFLFPQKSLEIAKALFQMKFQMTAIMTVEKGRLHLALSSPVPWTLKFSVHNIFAKGMITNCPSNTYQLWHKRFFHIVFYLLKNKMSQFLAPATSWKLSSGLSSPNFCINRNYWMEYLSLTLKKEIYSSINLFFQFS